MLVDLAHDLGKFFTLVFDQGDQAREGEAVAGEEFLEDVSHGTGLTKPAENYQIKKSPPLGWAFEIIGEERSDPRQRGRLPPHCPMAEAPLGQQVYLMRDRRLHWV